MDTELIVVIAAWSLFAVVALVLMYLDHRQLADVANTLAGALYDRADLALAPYGDRLRNVNMAAAFVRSLLDEDTDALAKLLPAELRAALVARLRDLETLTDGEPPAPPAAPPVEENAAIGGASK